ncbi:LysR family transcriptional regulator [Pseudomonas sp. RC10]|uniref:LysR family transcriptional regulator n=1 Tax=Pseudomonas bambusae TaxID=3139142 RepID=UPI003138B4E8
MDRMAAMQAFIYVVETGSFSSAARRLGIGQPAVSKIIAQLEQNLSVRLLIRSTRGLTPTEAGRAFYEGSKRSVDEANEAEVAARGAGAGLSGRLRVCAAVTFASLHVLPHLGTFLEQNPALEIDIVLDDRNVDLVEEGIDVALRMGVLADSALTARKIAEGRRRIMATPSYLQRVGVPESPAELIHHQAIVYSQAGGGSSWTLKKEGEDQVIDVNGRVRVSAAQGVRAAVLADLGIAMASEWMFLPELENGSVVTVLDDWRLPDIDLWAVFPAGRLVSSKTRAFVDFVTSLMLGHPSANQRGLDG